MIPNFKKSGLLPVGIHHATWQQLNETFGFNQHRQQLLTDLKKGLQFLQKYGCTEVCIDGSFVTSKPFFS
jgi:hypothetical protein